ncbi:MAG: hypothetical protein ABJO36_09255 [Litorimonas sp.]
MDKESGKLYFLAVASFLLAIFLIYEAITFEKSYPEYDDLLFTEGPLSDVNFKQRIRHSPSSLSFSISGDNSEFVYDPQSGVIITVRDLMKAGSDAKVGYIEEGRRRRSVYDLEIDGKKVRSYEEISASHKSDQKWSYLLIPWMLLSALFLFKAARRH